MINLTLKTSSEYPANEFQSGQCVGTLGHYTQPITSAAWAPDGQSFVIGSHDIKKPLTIWPTEIRRQSPPLFVFEDNCSRVQDCAIAVISKHAYASPEAARATEMLTASAGSLWRLVAAGVDKKIHIFDYVARKKVITITMEHEINCLSVSRYGFEMLVSFVGGRIWSMSTIDGEFHDSYHGQNQGKYIVRSCFGGATEGFVVSGGEGKFALFFSLGVSRSTLCHSSSCKLLSITTSSTLVIRQANPFIHRWQDLPVASPLTSLPRTPPRTQQSLHQRSRLECRQT